MSERGGMCRNPFGGRTRLDRLDLVSFLGAGAPQEKIIYLQTITDALHNYLFFGLGRNGTTAEEFAFACEYLFQIRASDKSTWPKDAVHMSFLSEGGTANTPRVMTHLELSDAQFRSMCFDTHYDYSGLSSCMPMEKFLAWLLQERTNILDDNNAQIAAYMDGLHTRACNTAEPGQQLPLPPLNRRSILIKPGSPADVARLVYLPKTSNPGRHCRKVRSL